LGVWSKDLRIGLGPYEKVKCATLKLGDAFRLCREFIDRPASGTDGNLVLSILSIACPEMLSSGGSFLHYVFMPVRVEMALVVLLSWTSLRRITQYVSHNTHQHRRA
jgi:hypothetical protein